jgi:8-oxo-dGTP pyrophosphatase MutT (NUDIX family)
LTMKFSLALGLLLAAEGASAFSIPARSGNRVAFVQSNNFAASSTTSTALAGILDEINSDSYDLMSTGDAADDIELNDAYEAFLTDLVSSTNDPRVDIVNKFDLASDTKFVSWLKKKTENSKDPDERLALCDLSERIDDFTTRAKVMATPVTNTPPVDASTEARLAFRHALPSSRLGQEHESIESFREAADFVPTKQKEYSLVVITEPARRRILLGEKHRGFGKGMHNSFGGKLEPGESDVESAKRELEEETGICVPMERMAQSKLGTFWFTFEDSPTEMVVHAFRINVSCNGSTTSSGEMDESIFRIDPSVIRGCEEITPVWFPDWHDIPLHNMFADDSVWLTRVLSSQEEVLVDGWFHFEPGGQEVNTILHYYMDFRPKNIPAHSDN